MAPFLGFVLALPYNGSGVSYTCAMIAGGMAGGRLDVSLFTPRTRKALPDGVSLVECLPFLSRRLPYRYVRAGADGSLHQRVMAHYDSLDGQKAAYLWGEVPVETCRALRDHGVLILREKVNCHKASARRILDAAHAEIGAPPSRNITDALIDKENRELAMTDYIFCPNRFVEETLAENGVPRHKLLPTSYGWEPARFAGRHRSLEPVDGPTYVFVGSICIRKGAHLLLRMWANSGIRGRLVLAGGLDPLVKAYCRDILERDDVTVLDFVSDVGALYRSADVFVFPSLEEGGPQVTYEAYGCGLPAVVSPMGAGRITRDGVDGFIIDPTDEDGWIAAMRRLADPAVRGPMAREAKLRADDFTWKAVGARRQKTVADILDGRARPVDAPQQTASDGGWRPGRPPLDAQARP